MEKDALYLNLGHTLLFQSMVIFDNQSLVTKIDKKNIRC